MGRRFVRHSCITEQLTVDCKPANALAAGMGLGPPERGRPWFFQALEWPAYRLLADGPIKMLDASNTTAFHCAGC